MRKGMWMIMEIVLWIAGGFCFLYFLVCGIYAGFGASYLGIWPLAGVVFILLALLVHMERKGKTAIHLPQGLKVALTCLVLAGVLLFAVMEGLIISGMFARGPKDLDYIIVLGAQVRGDRVSIALANRLEAAQEYLAENPRTVAVLSGGQGSGENLTEAQAMYDWLTEKGIDGERLILEDVSTDTWENMVNSRAKIGTNRVSVGIVTNNFHVYRGTMLAKCAGFADAHGIAGPSHTVMQLHYLVREGLALAKDILKYQILGKGQV